MQFNNFLWNNYSTSSSGKETIDFFMNYSRIFSDKSCQNKYATIVNSIRLENENEQFDTEYFNALEDFVVATKEVLNKNKKAGIVTDHGNALDIYNLLSELKYINDDGSSTNEDVFRCDDIALLSEILFIIHPDYFIPYYFNGLYHYLVKICNSFNIFIPDVPKKNNKRARLYHYFEICTSLNLFRHKFGLNKYELPAFLYGFAKNTVEKFEIPDNLPAPRRAYFIGGGKKDKSVDASCDFDYLDNAKNDDLFRWNGNPDTQPGDIIIMYCLSPRSHIHSIWRAVTPGYLDPFFHFYSYIYIGKPQHISPISIKEIKDDKILSTMSIVKANMQGINGRLVEEKYYNRIIHLISRKQIISGIPKLEGSNIMPMELANESDVEEKLLEPLLIKLGYTKSDWKRQLVLRMGRGEKIYPDYVIYPTEERNNESGYWVWEAKYSIRNNRQLSEDFGQVKSYALRLQCKGFGLASKEGIWLCTDSFELSKINFWTWKQTGEADSFNEIYSVAGNKTKF